MVFQSYYFLNFLWIPGVQDNTNVYIKHVKFPMPQLLDSKYVLLTIARIAIRDRIVISEEIAVCYTILCNQQTSFFQVYIKIMG